MAVDAQGEAGVWEGDETLRDAATNLREVERGLGKVADGAIVELDAAMRHIADNYEHEPD